MPPPVRTSLQVIRLKDKEDPVDTQTRHALKGDKFAQATQSSVSWLSGHRSGVLRWAVGLGFIIVLLVAAFVFWNVRSSAADIALGSALDTYSAPLAEPGRLMITVFLRTPASERESMA